MTNLPPPVEKSEPVKSTQKKKWYKKWWVWLIIVFIIVAISTSSDDQETGSDANSTAESVSSDSSVEDSLPVETTEAPAETVPATTVTETTVAVAKSAQQEKFMEAIEEGRQKIDDASTDLQQSAALRDRDKALCSILSSYVATDWSGTVKNIGANGEGKAYITIEIGDDARVQTWNNAFSDIGDNTLIPDTNPIFDVIVPLEKGDSVKFSAKFLKGRDTCLKQGNLTEFFYGRDPEFIVQFTKIEPSN